MGKRRTHEEFMEKFERDNPHIFNQLDFVEKYKGSNVPLIAKHKYGNVRIQPDRLYHMMHITSDSAVDKTTFLVNQAKEFHGDLYNYHLVNVEAYQHTVQIICSTHGIVPIDIYSHIQGAICPKCVIKCGFSRNSYIKKLDGRMSTCYIIHCFDDKENFYKIGISMDVAKRFNNKTKMPYEYELLQEFKGSAGYVYDLEKKLQKLHREQGVTHKPQLPFNGAGECFSEILWDEINKETNKEKTNGKKKR